MKEYSTLAELTASTQSKTGLMIYCRENLYYYIVQASGYVATGDDVTFANGRVGKASEIADAKYIKTVGGNVQSDIDSIIAGALPTQTGQQGKFLTTDGSSASWQAGTIEVETFAGLEALEPETDGLAFICQERGNAKYILQTLGYVALAGDVTFANGRVGKIQKGSDLDAFGGDDSGSADSRQVLIDSLANGDKVVVPDGTFNVESQVPVLTTNKTIVGESNKSSITATDSSGYGVGDAIFRCNGADGLFVSGINFNVVGASQSLRGVTIQEADNTIVKGITGAFTGRGTYPIFYVNESHYHHASDINLEFEDYGLLWKPQFSDAFVTDPADPNYHEGSDFLLVNGFFKGSSTNDAGKIGVSLDGEMVGGAMSGILISGISDANLIGEGFGIALANESDEPERFRGIALSGALIKDCRNEAIHFEDHARSFAGSGVSIVDCGQGIRIGASIFPTTTPPTPAIDTEGVFTGTVHTGYSIDGVREEAITIEGATHTNLGGEAHVFSDMTITNWNTDAGGWAAVWLPAELTNSLIFSNMIFREATGDVFRINADHGGINGFSDGPIIIENIIAHNVTGSVFDIVTTESNDHIFIKSGSILSGATDVFSSSSSLNNVISDTEFQSAQVTAGIAAGPTYLCKRMTTAGVILKVHFVFEDANTATVNDFWQLKKRDTGGTVTTMVTFGVGTSGDAAFSAKNLTSSLSSLSDRYFSAGDVLYMEKSGTAGDGAYSGVFEFNALTYF